MECPCCGNQINDLARVIEYMRVGAQQRIILRLLNKHFGEWVKGADILLEIYGKNGGPESALVGVAVIINKLKGILPKYNLVIQSHSHYGRRLLWADSPLLTELPKTHKRGLKGESAWHTQTQN